MRSCQAERLAAENAEEREVRLQHDRESHREWRVQETLGQLHLPLIQQRAVQAKIAKVPCTSGCTGGVPYSQNQLPAIPHLE